MKVAFDDADSEGIVFFGNYFRLAHRALEQWLPQQGLDWAVWFQNSEFGVPLRHVEAEYLSPLHPGEAFAVRIQVVRLGDTSLTFQYEFSQPQKTASLLARLKTSHVFVSRIERVKMTIPLAIRQVLQRHLVTEA